ncbi:hypothetical protein [Planctobacterium marinum]|uniref:hypothetical protein n=1 Tax=Planctobacterium marinum TaxID=1631968 RepID=UPI001E4B6F33|nr:hypothetical protein [Planctobacterium marinum]MCC2607418.1 hypothetical protein [Planctobacterium marinum]
MHYLIACFLLLSCSLVWANSPDASEIRIPGPRSSLDISHDYHTKLLRLALAESSQADHFTLTEIPFSSEKRVLAEMSKHNLIDVYWFGADKSLSRHVLPVTVPTSRGLIGFRKFIIHQKNRSVFDAIENLTQLRSLTACQGTYWPDTKILQNARLKVTTSTVYEDLFKMLDAERCDYFPRGYHDYTKEVQMRSAQYPDFQSYDPLLLHYPFAVFFYVAKSSSELAEKLQQGMKKLAQKGAITAHMQQHELTRHVFPMQHTDNVRLLEIANPYLPDGLDTKDETLWLQPVNFTRNTVLQQQISTKALPEISTQSAFETVLQP